MKIKNIIKVLLLGILFFSVNILFAQSEKKYLKIGDDLYEKADYNGALNMYMKAYDLDKNNAKTNFKIGKTHLNLLFKYKALSFLEFAYSKKKDIDDNIDILLADAYHYANKFEDAKKFYKIYMDRVSKNIKPEEKKRVERKLYECDNGVELLANPIEVTIENLGPVINTPYPEYAPVVSADESVLIFTSRREGTTGGERSPDDDQFYEDIYISRKVGGNWAPPQNIGKPINTETHDASIGLSANGRELFIYKDDGGGNIYVSKMDKNGKWSKPKGLDRNVNGKNSYENSVSISYDERILFFTSNKPGGFGGLDIYMSFIEADGDWGPAINLGPTINTEEDEDGPFFDFDGKTLHFSSKGHKGIGGFDIFTSEYDSILKTWTEPKNIGYPINTSDDDIYFVLSGDGRHGYYASVKEGGNGEKDIYMITLPPRQLTEDVLARLEELKEQTIVEDSIIKPEVVEEPVVKDASAAKTIVFAPVVLKGTITESSAYKPVSASIQVIDAKSQEIVANILSNDKGQYSYVFNENKELELNISVNKSGYMYKSATATIPLQTAEKQEVVRDFQLNKIETGKRIILRNIYYDFDKATIKPESNPELEKLTNFLKENPNVKIEIGGHTDSKGSNQYNIVLSQRRSESVVKYLIEKGIDKSKLVAKGYGEERPLASNDDEEEGREINRRTEFTVLGQ